MKKQPKWINTEQLSIPKLRITTNLFYSSLWCTCLTYTYSSVILFMGKYETLYGLLQYLLIKHYSPLREKFGRIITYQLWKVEVLHEIAVEGVLAALETCPC